MTRPLSWKRLLAVPAVFSLALGGALLTAAPAHAVPGDPVAITAPTGATPETSRTITVTGTGSDEDTVTVGTLSGDVAAVDVVVAVGGAWTTQLVFPNGADTAQTITADQTDLNGVDSSDDVAITLPEAVPAGPLLVTSPTDGATSPSRSFTFVGSAPVGSTVTVSVGAESVPLVLEADGTFDFPVYFGVALPDQIEAVVSGTDADGIPLVPVDLTLDLEPVIAAPVITQPVAGGTVSGSSITVTGTGVPGAQLAYVLVAAGAQSVSEAVGPIVNAAGNFSFSVPATPGQYTVGVLAVDVDGLPLSEPSNIVTFNVVAAAAPAATLPATGAMSAGFAGPAGALLLAGLLMVVASRRSAAKSLQL